MSIVTTDVCRVAIVDWLNANASVDAFRAAGLSCLLRASDWKQRTKVVRDNGETARTFTNGDPLDKCLASVEAVNDKGGNLIVRVDSATQPAGFIELLAIKRTSEPEPDRGADFGSW